MEELTDLIQQIATQSRKLKEALALKTEEIEQLKAELNQSKSLNTQFEKKLLEITEQSKREKTPVESKDLNDDLQERVNELVKEIDACILHLKQ